MGACNVQAHNQVFSEIKAAIGWVYLKFNYGVVLLATREVKF